MPFILRGVSLLGITSANCPRWRRERVWEQLGGDWKPRHLDRIVAGVVGMDELHGVFERMLAGEARAHRGEDRGVTLPAPDERGTGTFARRRVSAGARTRALHGRAQPLDELHPTVGRLRPTADAGVGPAPSAGPKPAYALRCAG
ncbi:MAG: hypothetical protein U5K43_04215 [Halofilum sp. (in: g-proteobacteria)]|nr:hypothetical protein [Halofilum sp. (in: g-proteobacteria)]